MTSKPAARVGLYRRCISSSSSTSNSFETDEECSKNIDQIDCLFKNNLRTWQPRHSVTRRMAKVAREVQSVWNSRLGPETRTVPGDKVKLLFNDMKLFPSSSQVNEMLQCARQQQNFSSMNSTSTTSGYLTLPEFCIFATELKRSSRSRMYRKDYFKRLLEKNGYYKGLGDRLISKNVAHREVFLGGSCNPTTWRQDEAIPLLNKLGITFYNPQVSEWSEELIELEHRAKEEADIMFNVVDVNKTRNVVSAIEASYYAGCKKKQVLVIYPFEGLSRIDSENISNNEFEDLKSSFSLLKQLVTAHNVPVFDNISDGIKCTSQMLKSSSINGICRLSSDVKLIKMKEAFETLDMEKCGQIRASDVERAIQILMNRKKSSVIKVRKLIAHSFGNSTENSFEDARINFEQFCRIVSELKICDGDYLSDDSFERQSNGTNFFRSLSTPQDYSLGNGYDSPVDIYLGGDCCRHSRWRDEIAVPLIRKSCLTFFNPESVRNDNKMLSAVEFSVIRNSNLLLFVITNDTRSLFTMLLAAFYIGVGSNVILCVQQLPENCSIESEKLSQFAINDYNRGRLYLIDFAKKENVPVYHSITEAVEAAIQKCIGR